jgi:hypothetical protein
MDFGGIERTGTFAPVFEGARNAFFSSAAPALTGHRLAPVLEGVFTGRVGNRYHVFVRRPEGQLEALAQARSYTKAHDERMAPFRPSARVAGLPRLELRCDATALSLKEGAAFCEGHRFLSCREYQAILSSFKRDEEYKKPRNTAAPKGPFARTCLQPAAPPTRERFLLPR